MYGRKILGGRVVIGMGIKEQPKEKVDEIKVEEKAIEKQQPTQIVNNTLEKQTKPIIIEKSKNPKLLKFINFQI